MRVRRALGARSRQREGWGRGPGGGSVGRLGGQTAGLYPPLRTGLTCPVLRALGAPPLVMYGYAIRFF